MAIFRRKQAAVRAAGAVIAPAAAVSRGLYRRLPRRVRQLVMVPLALAACCAVIVAGTMVYYTLTFPDPLSLRHKERGATVRVLARDGTTLSQRGGARDYIPLDLLPKLVVDAVVATEDRRFNDHWGLDPVGLIRASFANLRAGRFAQGGSTLTQQLAKNLFLTPERTMARKLEELLLAFWLELRLSKQEILELYLNHVYFGGGAYGIEAASQRFFDKSARELTVAEAAVIAGLLKAPSKYAPSSNPGAARARGRAVLAKMRDAGVITAEQERSARAEVVQFSAARRASLSSEAEYAVDYAFERLPELVNVDRGEIIVETTIDPVLQRKTVESVRKELVLQGSVLSANQAAAVVMEPDGAIRAMVGGRSHADSQFNRAVKALRQPGSAFKPFVYLAALEKGFTPDSQSYDLPLNVNGWAPQNDSGKYSGPVTLRHALAHSINTVAVRLALDVGPTRVAAVARRLGVKSELVQQPSLALGTSEVSLLEMTGAYGAFASGGRKVEPYIIRRVRMSSGRIIYARTASEREIVVAGPYLGAMNDMLNEVMIRGTGRRAAIPQHPAAGKTGTSQDFRDAWFIGYTAHYVAGIWVGNDRGAPMNHVKGSQMPATIWRHIMTAAHAGKEPLPLPGTTRPVSEPAPVATVAADNPRPAQANAPADPPAPMIATTGSLPTVGAQPEVLPWLVARPAGQGPAAPTETGTLFQAQPAYPQQSIDPDFIARALQSPPAGGASASASQEPRPARPGAKIVVRPPPGMMSLGLGLGRETGAQSQPDGSAGPVEAAVNGESAGDCGLWRYLTGC